MEYRRGDNDIATIAQMSNTMFFHKILMAKILYEKMLIKFYSLHTMGTTHKPHIDIYTTPMQWG